MGLIFGKSGKKLNLMQCYVLEFIKHIGSLALHNENRSYSASFSLYDGHISKYNTRLVAIIIYPDQNHIVKALLYLTIIEICM